MEFNKNNSHFKIGDLVEYSHPLPEFENILGVVLYITEISSNVYESGYIEATVRWSTTRWNAKPKYLGSSAGLFETFEDVSRLRRLTQ